MNINIAKYTLLAAAITLAACKRDDDETEQQQMSPEPSAMSFAASFEHSLSKAIVENNKTTSFQIFDAISLFDDVANNKFTTTTSGTSAIFTGEAQKSEQGYFALFPYSKDATIANGVVSTSIPDVQNGETTNLVAIAKIQPDDQAFTLKNVNSFIYFNIKHVCTSITIEASKNIVGNFDIAFDKDGNPTATITKGSKKISLADVSNGGYIAMLPVKGVDLDITYTTTSNKTEKVSFKNITLNRSEILDLGILDDLITISFDVSGISNAKAASLTKKPGNVTLPASIGDGIAFNGWYDADGNAVKGGAAVNVITDYKFTALASNEKIILFSDGEQKFTIVKDGKVKLPSKVDVAEGHEFLGWDFDQNTTEPKYKAGAEVNIADMYQDDLSKLIYAIMPLSKLTVTLDANGGKFTDGKSTKEVAIQWGESLNPSSYAPTLENHWLKGWEGNATHVVANVTLKAIWGNYTTITLTYYDYDGNVKETFSDDKCMEGQDNPIKIKNDIALTPAVASWNSKADGTGDTYEPGKTYKFKSNTSLYPVKPTVKVKVTYHISADQVVTDEKEGQYGEKVSFSIKTKDALNLNYALEYWNTKADGSGTSYEPGTTQEFDQNIDLYPIKEVHTITYYTNDGNTKLGEDNVPDGASVTLKGNNDITLAYTVESWNTKADGTGDTYKLGDTYTITQNLTLYPIASVSITYHDFNGNVIEGKTQTSVFVGSNVTFTLASDITLAYAIASWNTKANGTGDTYAIGANVQTDHNIDLYPVKAERTISYYDIQGNLKGTQKVKDGDNATLKERTDFTFSYIVDFWNTDQDANKGQHYNLGSTIQNVRSDIDLYAIPSQNQPSKIDNWIIEDF